MDETLSMHAPELDGELLNRWQQRFPLQRRPFAALAEALGLADSHGAGEAQVLARLRLLQQRGSLSRIGGIWAPGAAGSALLCAMAVPADRLEPVAAQVNAMAGVNHNYEREHVYNLWFVLTGPDPQSLAAELDALERQCGLATLRLPMERAYRINLGFDLRHPQRPDCPSRLGEAAADGSLNVALSPEERGLAACVEQGLPLLERPYQAWARQLGWTVGGDEDKPGGGGEARVIATLQRWLERGSLRRFGLIVRHHELGFGANAMCVFDVPDALVDGHAALLARQPGVTLCYRRSRAAGWPYNLFCMLHGRERAEVRQWLAQAVAAAGLGGFAQEQLFSRRRFKQCGPRYVRDVNSNEAAHA